jgi:hypothetical protein
MGGASRTPDQTRTLYACWKVETYTITYAENGGTLAGCSPTSYTVESEEIEPDCTEKTRTGYNFAGFSPATIPAGSTGDKTVTAQWIDSHAPTGSITINNGDPYTNSVSVFLTLSGSDSEGVTHMCISDSMSCASTDREEYGTGKSRILPMPDGNKTVYVQYKDAV